MYHRIYDHLVKKNLFFIVFSVLFILLAHSHFCSAEVKGAKKDQAGQQDIMNPEGAKPEQSRQRLAELKIGYINSQRILEESKVGKETIKGIEKLEKEKAEQIGQRKKEIEALDADLRKKEFALTPEKKKEFEDAIRQKGLELKFFEESKDKEIKEMYYVGLKKIESQVMDIVLKLGQESGYDLILGREESGILYANPKQDLTDKIIQLYDQQAQQ